MQGPGRTHEVKNQVPPLPPHDAFTAHRALAEALMREGGGWALELAQRAGLCAGGPALEWAVAANENPPVLHTHDRTGHRRDAVLFHPAWHQLMQSSVALGLHALPWQKARPGAHVARAAMFLTMGTAEQGHLCPISMTYSAVPALRETPAIADVWMPRLASSTYDSRFLSAGQKSGALSGMAMTEKQGGSDVRANSTVARPIGRSGAGAEYLLTGHKWFCSAPMCDLFLVLAQAPSGLSCFAVPRFLPDGTQNRFFLQRLKDKLGNRSNASSEVEFEETWGQLLGEEGRGVATILEMVNHTRLDCVLGAAGMMRAAVVSALHHTAHRSAFGKVLAEQPLMQNVLADLCIESEAATVAAMRLARAYDDADLLFRRLGTAVMKYWICKRTPLHVAEALECHGGNGYVEESGLPRLYREAPLNGIWEGSGNVICVDALRTLHKEPRTLDAFLSELEPGMAVEPRLRKYVEGFKAQLTEATSLEFHARRVVEQMALALQAALLVQHGHPAVAEAFVVSRLERQSGHALGTLSAGVDCRSIINRHRVDA